MGYMFDRSSAFNQDIGGWDVSNVEVMREMFKRATGFNQDIGGWNVLKVKYMEEMFFRATDFNQYIGKWAINSDCEVREMFSDSGVSKNIFEGKLYGNKIAEYFKLDNPNEFMVMDPFIRLKRWKRRKNAVMFFCSISKMDIDEESIESKKLNLIRKIDYDVYKEIVSFI